MHKIDATDLHILGAVSLERTPEGVKPWRIPHEERELFVPNVINGKPEVPAGVRIEFESDTLNVAVGFAASESDRLFDCVVDGVKFATKSAAPGETQVVFEGLKPGMKRIEVYLSQCRPVTLTHMLIDDGAAYVKPQVEGRLRWIAYGSSITQCEAAESPSQTWPAIVANRMNWHLTCLGFSANCHLEPMVARMIRDLPADFISLCLGINVMGGSSYTMRTFRAAVIGLVKTIRDRHPDIPILLQSPIYSKEREVTPNKADMTLPIFRSEIYEAYQLLRSHGDTSLYYLNGLDVLDESYADYLPDLLHPNAEGYKIMAERFERALRNTVPELFVKLQ